jgi:hypothetical protein
MTDEDTCVFLCIRKSNVHIQDTSDIELPEEGKKNWKNVIKILIPYEGNFSQS